MVTVHGESDDVKVFTFNTDKAPYMQIAKNLFFLDICEGVAQEIIDGIESGKIHDIDHITFQQDNIYRNLDEYKAGLAKLFDYMIFDNQQFVGHINIITPDDEYLKATKEQIVASQKIITKTGQLFPTDGPRTVLTSPIKETLRGNVLLTKGDIRPLESTRLNYEYGGGYEELKDRRDKSKDGKVPADAMAEFKRNSSFSGGGSSGGSSSSSGKTLVPRFHYVREHYWHDLINIDVLHIISNTFGPLNSTKQKPAGNLTIDIWKHTKDDWVWKVKETDEIPKPPEHGEGGGDSDGTGGSTEILIPDQAFYPDR